MSNQRLHVIQEWAEKAINLDQSANTAIALGVALAHINELASALTAANAETARLQLQLNLDALKTKTETTPFIYTPPNPLQPFTTTPLDQTLRTPFIMRYGADGNQTLAEKQVAELIKNYNEEVTFNNELSLPVIDGNAEFKTEFYGSQTYNEPQVTTNLEKELGAALIQAAHDAADKLKSFDEKLQDSLDKSLNTPVDVDAIVENHSAVEGAFANTKLSVSEEEPEASPMQDLLDNDSWSVNSVERVTNALEYEEKYKAANCVNIEQKYDEELFTKPTTLKSLLDKHFEEVDGEPYFVAQIKTPTIDELTPIHGEYDYTPRFAPAVNNLTPEQIVGTQPFTGTLADLPTYMPASHSGSAEWEADKAAYTERNTRLMGEKFAGKDFIATVSDAVKAETLFAEALLAEAAFIKKYGGKVAVIDTPFDGLAVMAPGMNEDGRIGSVSYNEQYAQQLITKANELIEETK